MTEDIPRKKRLRRRSMLVKYLLLLLRIPMSLTSFTSSRESDYISIVHAETEPGELKNE